MAFKYLSNDILEGFDKYKYNAVDTSPVSKYITHPFWNWFVQFYPKWVAPNVLTFAGLLCLVLEFAIMTYYDCNFHASDKSRPEYAAVPNWIWFVCGQCMFWAHTLDGTDGKQARRTHTSGPLGELFDHGIDSLATLLMPVGLYSIYGCGEFSLPADRVYFIILGVMITFIISHWEKYNTGVLFLPWAYDISQIGMTAIFFITSAYGYEMWKISFPSINMTAAELFEIITHIGIYGLSVPMTIWNLFHAWRTNGLKQPSLWEGMRPLFPVVLQFGLLVLWLQMSSYNIINRHPRLFYTATGFVFSNIATRLIVNGMSGTRCQVFNWLLIPLIAIVLGVYHLQLGIIEYYLLWAYTLLVVAAHLHYAICVVQQLSDHLGIYTFSLQPVTKTD